jgi:hypothetical protein
MKIVSDEKNEAFISPTVKCIVLNLESLLMIYEAP